MSNDLETRLGEAFAARAATTTASDDAWARVNRRSARHDHRRSVVLRSVAAAAVVLLVVGGGVALFRDRGGSGTVATGGSADASKSMAEDSASSAGGEVIESAPVAPLVPAGNGLEVQQNPDGTIVVRFGSTTTAPVQPGDISAAIDGDTVFGVVPVSTTEVRFGYAPSEGEAVPAVAFGGAVLVAIEGVDDAELFIRVPASGFPGAADAVAVTAESVVGGSAAFSIGETIARRNG